MFAHQLTAEPLGGFLDTFFCWPAHLRRLRVEPGHPRCLVQWCRVLCKYIFQTLLYYIIYYVFIFDMSGRRFHKCQGSSAPEASIGYTDIPPTRYRHTDTRPRNLRLLVRFDAWPGLLAASLDGCAHYVPDRRNQLISTEGEGDAMSWHLMKRRFALPTRMFPQIVKSFYTLPYCSHHQWEHRISTVQQVKCTIWV